MFTTVSHPFDQLATVERIPLRLLAQPKPQPAIQLVDATGRRIDVHKAGDLPQVLAGIDRAQMAQRRLRVLKASMNLNQ